MIADLNFDAYQEFLDYCRVGEIELEAGVWRLAQTRRPDLDVGRYRATVRSYVGTLAGRMKPTQPAEDWLATINRFLFEETGFRGNRDNYYDPDNSYLDRVIDRRLGIPITLSAVYLLVGSQLNLDVQGVGMPGHFICRLEEENREFFIDPFDRGRVLTRTDCIAAIRKQGIRFEPAMLEPVSPRRMLQRMCANLLHIYSKSGRQVESRWFEAYIEALKSRPGA